MKNSNEISQELWEKIENYIFHEMSDSEKHEFENEIEKNPILKSQIEEVQSFSENTQRIILKEKLDEFHREISSTPQVAKKIPINKTIIWTAACFILLITTVIWLNTRNTPERIFEKHYTHDPGLPTTMSNSGNYEFFDGMLDYKQQNYQTALEKWKPLLAENPNNDTLNYFVGLSYLAIGETEEAEALIENVAGMNQSMFYEDAIFYTALVMIKKGETEKAAQLLSNQNSDRSQKLLDDLKK